MESKGNTSGLYKGKEFENIVEAREYVNKFAAKKFFPIRERNNVTVEGYNKKVTDESKLLPEMMYYSVHWECKHAGFHTYRGEGIRSCSSTFAIGCPFKITISYERKKNKYLVTILNLTHNHEISEDVYKNYPDQRRPRGEVAEQIDQMLIKNCSAGNVQEYARSEGYEMIIKDIYNRKMKLAQLGAILPREKGQKRPKSKLVKKGGAPAKKKLNVSANKIKVHFRDSFDSLEGNISTDAPDDVTIEPTIVDLSPTNTDPPILNAIALNSAVPKRRGRKRKIEKDEIKSDEPNPDTTNQKVRKTRRRVATKQVPSSENVSGLLNEMFKIHGPVRKRGRPRKSVPANEPPSTFTEVILTPANTPNSEFDGDAHVKCESNNDRISEIPIKVKEEVDCNFNIFSDNDMVPVRVENFENSGNEMEPNYEFSATNNGDLVGVVTELRCANEVRINEADQSSAETFDVKIITADQINEILMSEFTKISNHLVQQPRETVCYYIKLLNELTHKITSSL